MKKQRRICVRDTSKKLRERHKIKIYFDIIFQFNIFKLMYILFTKLKSSKLICDLIKVKDYVKSIVHISLAV